jgi:hypothetical protein
MKKARFPGLFAIIGTLKRPDITYAGWMLEA